jgi:hypothetical protein
MRSNVFTLAFCALAIPASVIARPDVHALSARSIEPLGRAAHPIALRRRNQRAQIQQASQEAAQAGQETAPEAKEKEASAGNKQKEAVTGNKEKAAEAGNKEKEAAAGNKEKEAAAGGKEGAAGEEAAGEEEAKESMLPLHLSVRIPTTNNRTDEVEIESAFDAAVPVEGGELKQDLVFTPSTVGKFEFEFQSATADEITVTENAGAAAAAPPAGFEAIEPNSYTVALAVSKGAGLTLSKIDYIFDAAAAGLAGKDVTQAQVGKLCTETGSFVISSLLGELEFEAEENEVTLNLNKNVTAEGQWGEFLNHIPKIEICAFTNISKVSSFLSPVLVPVLKPVPVSLSKKKPKPSKKKPPKTPRKRKRPPPKRRRRRRKRS